MSLDPLLPTAPARVKALLLPLGQIRTDRFVSFVDRLHSEHVVHLRDVTPDGRPNRNMFSPLAFPDGAILYDLITHVPPPSHTALTPFDLYREPLAVIALADGSELGKETFSKSQSVNGSGPTMVEKSIRALYQELEDLRDQYPKALVHQVLIFDYVPPASTIVPIPEGVLVIPPTEDSLRTTMKTVMCDISSQLLAEMTTLARSFEQMTSIESPVHYSGTRPIPGKEHGANGMPRRNSQYSVPHHDGRSASVGVPSKHHARMSMPPVPTRPAMGSSSSTPGRPSTPVKNGSANAPGNSDGPSEVSSTPSTPERTGSRPVFAHNSRDTSSNRVSVQGFGPGGANDKWRLKGKGRASIVIGSLYLQAGRWSDSLRELSEGATAARSLNDHIWHGKALELILMNLFLLGWSRLEFQIPSVCLPTQDGPSKSSWSSKVDAQAITADQPKHLRNLQLILPELLDKIVNLYSRKRTEAEKLPNLPFAETVIRSCKILTALHMSKGELNQHALDIIVTGKLPAKGLTTSPRLHIVPTRQQIVNLLMEAFPSSPSFSAELLTTVDRASILSGIAAVLGPLGFQRKKAMVIRELVSVLIAGLVEARTRGAADAGVHPAAGLVSLAPGSDPRSGVALDVGHGDIEYGIEAFLELLCRSYGIVALDQSRKITDSDSSIVRDSDEAIVARIHGQSASRFFGFTGIKLNILRACINFAEALPDFNGVLKFSSDLLRTAGSGVAPGARKEDSSPIIFAEEQARFASNIARTWSLAQQLGIQDCEAEYWDEFLVRGIKLEPLPSIKAPIPHAHSALPGASAGRASQDVDPFIYNPFLKKPEEVAQDLLVAGDMATFRINLQNTYDTEVDIESIQVETDGATFEAMPSSTRLGPNRTQLMKLHGRPMEAGQVKITGAIVKVRGCRERRFPIFTQPWHPVRDAKSKVKGVAGLEESLQPIKRPGPQLSPESLGLTVIEAQPLVSVKSTSLSQASVMILEGERQIFSVTLQNMSATPVDFMLFSFRDSTQEPLKAALANRDASPAELHEYELILMKKQALRIPKGTQTRFIEAGGEATFEFEILGKPGLTHASIQVDYTYLGKPREEVTEQFYTRQASLDLTITVNGSLELPRADILPLNEAIPSAFWAKFGKGEPASPEDYCLLSLDVRNIWPSLMSVHIQDDDGLLVDDAILPGNTNRVLVPVRRVFLEDPHAAIPSLNPAQNKQFVVSSTTISPEAERDNREAFWYRERMLDRLRATWTTTKGATRSGTLELRNIRFNPRMVEAIKVDEIGMDMSIQQPDGLDEPRMTYTHEAFTFKVRVTNRTSRPISPIIRIMPALCHRSKHVALDLTRKLAWNGTLQRVLPNLQGHESTDILLGMTALTRGQYELATTVEELRAQDDPGSRDRQCQMEGRPRSDSQNAADAAIGTQGRRVWHSRRPFILTVRDRD
ncbi:Transport protein particle subunit-like protein [Emericellopsis cladophorae]|uniref:Transport protein particle subunit-like protein n=1 Tax=Emericellopsis cladophorae TaxID=2686198 RepID=A0A9P9Y8I9_9HYPO|nr:Transport protein particle subunit-like protein [Emericellopsis cladophorae]KAI6785048.1 Transport protein particle subunit-like protein [Emericellopsis cladophorae]